MFTLVENKLYRLVIKVHEVLFTFCARFISQPNMKIYAHIMQSLEWMCADTILYLIEKVIMDFLRKVIDK